MEYVSVKTPRKPDYVSYFAVLLFVFVGLFELLLVVYLPSEMSSEKGKEEEMARQIMINLEDSLRRWVKSAAKKVKTGEVEIVSERLDAIARYLRLNRTSMTREQVRDVMSDLTKFETIIRGWKDGKSYSVKESLDTGKYLDEFLNKRFSK